MLTRFRRWRQLRKSKKLMDAVREQESARAETEWAKTTHRKIQAKLRLEKIGLLEAGRREKKGEEVWFTARVRILEELLDDKPANSA